MKKLFVKIFILLSLCFIPGNTFAAGGFGISTSNVTLTPGGSTTVNISVTNAAGRIDITSSNPGVASVSKGSEFVDAYNETRSYSFTIVGNSAGSAVITVTPVDLATYDKEVVSSARQITVTVNNPAPPVQPDPTPSDPTPSNPTPSNPTPSNPKPTEQADKRSNNTNLSSLSVNGKTLNQANNVYTLEVGNYLDNVDITAKAADSKAKVSGTGNKTLKVGENEFSIVVTAENGSTKTYTVKIIRREYNLLSDLDELLKLNKDAEIRISDTDKLTKDQLDKIRKSNKKITLNKMSDDNKKVLYSLILDGKKIKSVDEFNPNIKKNIEHIASIEEAVNYADGIYLDFSECGDIPKGMILRLYVGDKYKDNDKVNLYMYASDKIVLLGEGYTITDGYIEFEVTNKNYHFISKAKVLNAESNELNIWFIVSVVLGVIILGMGIIMIVGKMKNKSHKVHIETL